MNGTREISHSPSHPNSTAVAAVASSIVTSVASAPDLPSVATSSVSPTSSQPQTLTPPPQSSQAPALSTSQRPSVVITLPNQIPVVANSTSQIVFAAASTVPSGSIMVPSSAITANIPTTLSTSVNLSNGSVVTIAMDNTSKPAGSILTATTPTVSIPTSPIIQAVTSVAALTSSASSTQQSRQESPHQSHQLQIPALKNKSLQEIIKEVDPYLQLDDETEEMIKAVAEEFLENVARKSVKIAGHRGSTLVEPRDVKHVLEHHWDITIPGFPTSQEKAVKRPFITHAHRQHMAILQKQVKRS